MGVKYNVWEDRFREYAERVAECSRIAHGSVEPHHRKTDWPVPDDVNLPTHYRSHPSGIECIQVTEHMNFNCGNAVKYIWRNGLKPGNTAIQDLRKAEKYIQREIARLEKQNVNQEEASGNCPQPQTS